MQVFEAFFLAAAQPHQSHGDLHAPRQAAHHVVVRSNDQLRVDVVRVQFQHAFVVVAGADSIAQSGKPGALHQGRIEGELGASYAAGVECLHVVGIAFELLLLQTFGAFDQLFDLLFYLWVGGAMRLPDKAVITVFAGIHRAHSVELTHQDRGQ